MNLSSCWQIQPLLLWILKPHLQQTLHVISPTPWSNQIKKNQEESRNKIKRVILVVKVGTQGVVAGYYPLPLLHEIHLLIPICGCWSHQWTDLPIAIQTRREGKLVWRRCGDHLPGLADHRELLDIPRVQFLLDVPKGLEKYFEQTKQNKIKQHDHTLDIRMELGSYNSFFMEQELSPIRHRR